jgi:hypothetical protein
MLLQRVLNCRYYRGSEIDITGPTVKYALDVDVENVVPPTVLRDVIEWGAPCNARIVHEDV